MKETESKTQNKPQKPQSKGVKILKTVLNTVINVLIVLVLIVSLLIAVMALTSKANGISTMFGYTIQPIQSDSMKGGSPDGYPSGDFGAGDLMIAKSTGFDANAEYQLGDIVTFRTVDSSTNEVMLIVHRIVDVQKKENGIYTYQTQGDNRETSPVPDQAELKDYLYAADIGSVYYNAGYEGKILKGWGKVLDFLQSQQGFFFVVLLPMIIFFMYELIRVILNAMRYKNSKAQEEKDEAVKAAVAEALAEQKEHNDKEIESIDDMTPEQREQFKQFLAMQKAQQSMPEEPEAAQEAGPSEDAEETAEESAPETDGSEESAEE